MVDEDRGAGQESWIPGCQTGTVYHPKGHAIRYWLFGETGPVLFLCNGLCSGPDLWVPLVKELHGSHRLLLWDYPGQGMSSFPSRFRDRTGVRALARYARLLLDGVGIDEVVVMGQGLGVQVAVEMMSMVPERVLGLVGLCGVSAGPVSRLVPALTDRVLERLLQGLVVPVGIPAWKVFRALVSAAGLPADGRGSGEAPADRPWGTRSGVMDTANRTDPHTGLCLLTSMLFHHPTVRRDGTNTPVLLLAGKGDRLVTAQQSRRTAGLLPGSRLVFLPGRSHQALREDPESVIRHVRAFLREHGLV